MANQHFSSSLLVEVDGKALPTDIEVLLTYAMVDDSRRLPDRFVLRFRDPGRVVLAKAGFKIGTSVKLKVRTTDSGTPQPLMSGEVTAMELDLDKTGTVTEVRGLDHSHRLYHGRRVAAYPNMSVADVVRKVTQRAGLSVGKIDNPPGTATGQHDQISQDNVSDWDFLARLADLAGAQVVVRDGKLDFLRPEKPQGAPGGQAKASENTLVLEAGSNLVSLRAGITAAEQVPQVIGRGWDPGAKAAVEATAPPKLADAQVGGVDPAKLGEGSPPYVIPDPTLNTDGQVKALAEAMAIQLGGTAVEIDGVARGNPSLRAGTAVSLANVGEPFAGNYTLTATRHLFNPESGYTTAFTVSGRNERSLYGLTSGGGQGSHGGERGLVPAIVSDIKDPDKLGRVKLVFPWLDKDFTSSWARVVLPGAGNERGLLVLPEVGDEVLAGFTHGDIDAPFVLGGLYNGKDKLPKTSTEPIDSGKGEVAVRAWVGRKGHKLELAEADGITLATGDGKLSLKLDLKQNVIELTSSGKVVVKGDKGISFDAGSGDLEFAGKSFSLKGQQAIELDAMTLKINGKSTAEVTSSGTLTVRGSMVRIN
ncbi:MAG TPA: VgrG-related protein [Candidatus Limnocylindrales bacterium]|nr:VgrG-related protein [Candidatus Limnocylindrales bacterium]